MPLCEIELGLYYNHKLWWPLQPRTLLRLTSMQVSIGITMPVSRENRVIVSRDPTFRDVAPQILWIFTMVLRVRREANLHTI